MLIIYFLIFFGLATQANPPSISVIGREYGKRYDNHFSFLVNELSQGEKVTYARLRFAGRGGEITSSVNLMIQGIFQDFSQEKNSSQNVLKTHNEVSWKITKSWLSGTNEHPLYYSSPNIVSVINEIIAQPEWGIEKNQKKIFLKIEDHSSPKEVNKLFFQSSWEEKYKVETPVILETYKTVYDTFLGKEFLGRVTDSSVTINLYSLIPTDVVVEYGIVPGDYVYTTQEYLNQPANQPIEIILENLKPNTRYYYRLCYREAGQGYYEYGKEHTFHTQRPPGSSFVFTVTADEHILANYLLSYKNMGQAYLQTLSNVQNDSPDFAISLGDFALTKPAKAGGRRHASNLQEAIERYLFQRKHLDLFFHSIPFYLAIGNHEGEQGKFYNFERPGHNNDSLSVISTKARKAIVPNPRPDGFYAGNLDCIPEYGLREDYFAWEWGDALFVVLDPYWYTKYSCDKCSNFSYWTLGKQQYEWLYKTLGTSRAKWKFIFIHHLTTRDYGRGGIEVVKYRVAQNPTDEWGGENEKGEYIFDTYRPGWKHGPIHDILVKNKVTAVFHGHDHFYAYQELDGIVYQECPLTGGKGYGFKDKNIYSKYLNGIFRPSGGHIRVKVNSDFIQVEYVHSCPLNEKMNGTILHSYKRFIDS